MTTMTSAVLTIAGLAPHAADQPATGPTSFDILGGGSRLMADVNAFTRATPWLHGILYGYATYGVALFAVLLLAGWWTARRSGDPTRMAAALWAALGTVLAVGINQPVVNAVHEARPYQAMQGLLVLADRSTDFSFPSDHAVMAGAAAAGLLLVRRGLGWAATVAALLIAFARVYIAAHYPQDVAAGLLLGAAVVLIGWVLLRGVATVLVRMLHRTPLRSLVTGIPATAAAMSMPSTSAATLEADTVILDRGADRAAEPVHGSRTG